jgi:predicted AlkP superfamily phosphohydrolase/phosphomutase
MTTAGALVKPELLVIGLDGATFDVIDPMIQQGHLPHLARLMRAGARATLRSTVPPYSAAAWTSFLTGLQPRHHGIYSFIYLDREAHRVRPRRRFGDAHRTLLGMLNAAGKRVCCVGMPMTYPPYPLDGVIVPGFDAPHRLAESIHPPELFEHVSDLLAGLTLKAGMRMRDGLEPVREEITRETELVLRLQALQPSEVVMVVFPQSDHVGHRTRDAADAEEFQRPLPQTYEALDQAVGRLLAELTTDETTVMVLSDHGIAPEDLSVDLDTLLCQLGLMGSQRTAGGVVRSIFRWALRGLRDGLRRVGLDAIVDRARRSDGLTDAVARLNPAHPDNLDWSRTRVVATGGDGFLCMNVAGRERLGIIPPREYESARTDIIARLRAVTAPDGRPAFAQVLTVQEALGADLVDAGCADILVVPRTGLGLKATLNKNPRAGMLTAGLFLTPQPHGRTSPHDPLGIFICRSPHTPAGRQVPEVSLPDMAPTLLYALGLPVPEGLDGQVITPLFDHPFQAAHPLRYGPALVAAEAPEMTAAYTSEEEAAIEARLQDLGYV